MKELVVDKIGEYEIVDEIGRGGMGVVYQAVSNSGESVALKICGADTVDLVKRFKREVRAIQKIHHKNVMPVLYADLDSDPPYYVMPLAKQSVFDIIDELSSDHKKALEVFLQICYGVQAAHLAGECHRDIKPQNALIMPDESIVVSDFGLVKFFDRDTTLLTKTDMCIGTEMYMAPEQFLPGGSRDATSFTDIYQLGKNLYQLYTGRYPAVLTSDGIPANLWYIIQKATKQKPSERFSDVAELIDTVNEYIASLDPQSNPQESFYIELKNVNDQLSLGLYKKESVDRLINILMLDDVIDEMFLDLFDKLPEKILGLYAKEFPEKLLPLVQKHSKVLERNIANKHFDYAEIVASKMQIIYQSTTDLSLKSIALISVLIVAVDLNRFRAMNVFNCLLVSIQSNDEAFVISKALKENIDRYARIFNQVGKEQLHKLIQAQWIYAFEQ